MSQSTNRRVRTTALVGAGVAAGVIGAWALSSDAQGSTTSGSANPGTSATSAPTAPTTPPSRPAGGPMGDHPGIPGGGPGGFGRGDENELSGTKAATLKAAALKQVPGGSVQRVETDSGDAAYEVHMTDKDGQPVTVKFDKNLKFVAVENGMGK